MPSIPFPNKVHRQNSNHGHRYLGKKLPLNAEANIKIAESEN